MKKLYTSLLLLLSCLFAIQAQDCGDRYKTVGFPDTPVEHLDLQYSSGMVTIGGNSLDLEMDIYEPANDTLAERPVILWIHGGSFVAGSRGDMKFLCERFSRRGYVTATMTYRLYDQFAIPDSTGMYEVVVKAAGDAKSAIRYLRKSYEEGNPYGIDPDQIFVGGISAGAILAVHVPYLDDEDDVAPFLQGLIDENGGIAGNGGNDGFSYEVSGVISLSGGIAVLDWMENNDEPLISFHDTGDGTVPYAGGYANVFGLPIAYLHGGALLHEKAMALGIDTEFYSYDTDQHVSMVGASDIEETDQRIADFLYRQLDCYAGESVSIEDEVDLQISVYPNPSNGFLNVEHNESARILLHDLLGRELLHESSQGGTALDLSALASGVYLLQVQTALGTWKQKINLK